MKRIDLNITDVFTTEDTIVIHGTQENTTDLVEIVIPLKQVPAIIGVLEPEAPKPTKKGGK